MHDHSSISLFPWHINHILTPATRWQQGNVFTPVCQSFHSHAWQGGACVVGGAGRGHAMWGTCMAGGHVCIAGGIHEGVHGRGVHVGGMHVGGMHGWGCVWPGGVHGWGDVCMAGEMATAAGGTQPAGMHSCGLMIILVFSITQQ